MPIGQGQGNVTMQVTKTGSQLWNQAMQVAPPNDQMLNEYKWCHLVAQFSTDAGGITLWPKLKLMQVAPPGDARSTNCWPQAIHLAPSGGQIFNYCK